MKHLNLLGTPLKSEFLLDLFETYDVQVIYEYDRTHENLHDEYHAKIDALGLEFAFDQNQILRTLFMTPTNITTFNPFEDDDRLHSFDSKPDARRYAQHNCLSVSEGETDFMNEHRDWIRFEKNLYWIHYEYVESALRRITLQTPNA